MRRITYTVLIYMAITLNGLPAAEQPTPKQKGKAEGPGPITARQLKQSAKQLEHIALAFHNYSDDKRALPTNQLSKDKKPLLSWRVQVLPYIEQEPLYQQFKLDEPWDSEHNKKLIAKMPRMYAPVRGKVEPGMTFYQAFGGSRGWLKPGARLPSSFPDGTSNTFLVAEAAKPVVWTKPADLIFNGKDVPELGGLFDGRFHAAMADGSVNRFRKGIDANILKLLIDPADGIPLPADFGIDTTEVPDTDDPHEIPAAAKAILDTAESLELLSLDLLTPDDNPKGTFHGWKVLGKKAIDKAEVRKSLVLVFEKGVAEYKEMGKKCFLPRHGIRVKHAGKVADFVICFECNNVRVYVDGGVETEFLVSDSPAKTFNNILKDAGVKLPAQPKK
jgi:Protein of unknown function (DUF1559)